MVEPYAGQGSAGAIAAGSTLPSGTARSRARNLLLCVGAVVFAALIMSPRALASEAIEGFTTTTSTTQAGGHPDLSTSFELANPGEPEAARNVVFNAPEGVFGNPYAITHCTSSDFALDRCPSDSQAGLITVYANYEGSSDQLLGTAPIFDLETQGEETALFAFIVPTLDIPINIPVAVRTAGDYGLRFTVSDITQITPIAGAKMTFWGFPAIESHDVERFPKGSPGEPANCAGALGTGCIGKPTAASIPPEPLTDNPTTCPGSPLNASLEVQTYEDPEHLTRQASEYPATTGCDLEVFNPVLYASPTIDETDSPSGLNVELSAPQFLGFAASPSEIKAASVTLPEGFTINPDAADGQTACSDAEANFGSEGRAACPDHSKIGTFSIGTQALPGRLEGAVYIGEPQPGNQYRLFLIASGFGINAKLVGSFRPNLQTGRVTAYFEGLPQVPFDDFQLHLFASDRGLMATPTQCTIYRTTAEFYPWNATLAEQESSQIFGLKDGPHGSTCPGEIRPFSPTLEAGTSNATAGEFSSFTLKLNREDGDQYLGKLNFTMPPGLTASLTGVTYCTDQQIAAAAQNLGRIEQMQPSCPASSEIGTSNVAAGPGSHPFHAIGKVYLAGPFQGAPLSLVVVTPALAGPYDYGTVVVRVAIRINPLDAHVIADSETVPEIIGGIPIRMREIKVNINRPNFMINPTNCNPLAVGSEGVGDQGTAVAFSSYFHVVNCALLSFRPRMSVTQLGGRKATSRGQDPAIRFDLRTRSGDANIKSIALTLPNALEIDQNHLGNLCAKSELEATHCAGRQAIGTVKDETPLLERPLEGLAYAVSGYKGLPHVAFILDGQVSVIPQGESKTISNQRLRTLVPVVPDVPVGHFQLTLFGKGHGYLANTRSLCGRVASTTVEFTGQNGKKLSQKVPINAACGTTHKRHKRRRRN